MPQNSLAPVATEGVVVSSGAFKWSDVPQEHRDWLRKRTQDVESFAYRIACDIVRIGQVLAEVRQRVGWGLYSSWLATNTPFGRSQAYRMISAAAAFGVYLSQIETIEPSALYVLAQDKTPQAAREHAVQLASEGKRVTRAAALEIVDAYKPVTVTEKEAEEYGRARKKLDLIPVEKIKNDIIVVEDVDQDAATALQERQDDSRRARAGRAIEELVRRARLIRIEKLDDVDDVDLYSVTCHFPDDGPRNVVDRRLDRALVTVCGTIETKYCRGCDEQRPIELFGANKKMTDMLMARCKICEKSRKREMRVSERAKRAKPATPEPTAQAIPRSSSGRVETA